ncbi:MAG: DUF3536 domain-containing protein [Acidimicrobiaceae bacterium]|nr:DUF3536 domain-containing protein [Acidimicrobiaceae bacterium]
MSPIAGFHYHFYQPPREDPWTGLFNHEWSAWPYHDWNERIAAECYRAMVAVALENEDATTSLFEPLTQSSFDLGPTLHHWLAKYAPDVETALQREMRASSRGAHRVVVAAPLVHAIVPLATPTDQERLVAWGIDDFRSRYGEEPVGMWLPETGVDLATLEVLARQGITYTVLMPTQAAMTRAPGEKWVKVGADTLDTSKAYFVSLPSGARITVVFGHHDLSQSIAFGDLVADGNKLADTMIAALGEDDGVVLIVADGETYGHHHRFGDIGVAWATRRLQEKYQISTTLGEWLSGRIPTHEVQLHDVSAWSCAHGVERWRSACGCVTGERAGFDLKWRAPLRDALDWLREHAGSALDWELGHHVQSSDAAVLDYGKVIAGEWSAQDFLGRHQNRELNHDERSRVLEVCEAHRNLMYSFTSCAWFFADPAEIETSIVLRYAALALELTRRTTGRDFETPFVQRLAAVRSAHYDISGEQLWQRACDGFRTDEVQIAAGAAAEFASCGDFARTTRGTWSIHYQPGESAEVRITLTNTLTLRKFTFLTHTTLGDNSALFVDISDNTMWRRVDLERLGADVISRVAVARMMGKRSSDVEGTLSLLASDLLHRRSTHDDEVTLLALAAAPRFVTPVGEAAIRRALWAIVAHDHGDVDRVALEPLVLAMGLQDTFNLSKNVEVTH